MPSTRYSDLEMAMEFVSGGSFIDARAYIARENGEIFWESDDSDLEEELPEDLGEPDLYAEVPSKRDLDLGKPLALKFSARVLPEAYDEIEQIFRRRGAYSRYKALLSDKGRLQEWYEYEETAIEKQLIDWAEAEGFVVEKDSD